jgi:hypothetical protein
VFMFIKEIIFCHILIRFGYQSNTGLIRMSLVAFLPFLLYNMGQEALVLVLL